MGLNRYGKEKPAPTREEAVEAGRKGGLASAKKRRENMDIKRAFEIIDNLPVKGKVKKQLTDLGIPEDEQVGSVGIVATIYAMAMNGDREILKKYLDYKIQLSENDRKELESKARIEAMVNGEVQVTSQDDNEGMIQIYLPAIEDEEKLTVDAKNVMEND